MTPDDERRAALKEAWGLAEPFRCATKLDAFKLAGFGAMNAKNNLGVALAYLGQGFPVVPVNPTGNRAPLLFSTYDPITTEAAAIAAWADHPQALVAINSGRRTGFFALDCDAKPPHKHDGIGAWAELVAKHAAEERHLKGTRTHASPNAGKHVIYRWDPDRPVGGSTGKLPEGIEVKGEGLTITMAGSFMPDGRRYAVGLDWNPEPAPDWLYALLLVKRGGPRPGAGRPKGKPNRRSVAYAKERLTEAIEKVRTAPEGGRNDVAKNYVLHIGSLIGAGYLDEEETRARLHEAAAINKGEHTDWPDKVDKALDTGIPTPTRTAKT